MNNFCLSLILILIFILFFILIGRKIDWFMGLTIESFRTCATKLIKKNVTDTQNIQNLTHNNVLLEYYAHFDPKFPFFATPGEVRGQCLEVLGQEASNPGGEAGAAAHSKMRVVRLGDVQD
ncbi:MAG: hypothetical protein MRZ32_08850 [Bacteroidales bacterium]|nr:hypothetical protein [Bacteroidales bacterium]